MEKIVKAFKPETDIERLDFLYHHVQIAVQTKFYDYLDDFINSLELLAPDKVIEWVESEINSIFTQIRNSNPVFSRYKRIVSNNYRARLAVIETNIKNNLETNDDLFDDLLHKPFPKAFLEAFIYNGLHDIYLNPNHEIYSGGVSVVNFIFYDELIELLANYKKWLFLQLELLATKEPESNILNQSRKLQKQKISYVWQGKAETDLPELYSLMTDEHKLIALETTYEQFKAVFTGQPIDEIKPIKWHQENASELLYFIDRLEQSGNIAHNPKRADYQRLTACFVKPDGKQFNVVWKSLKTNIDINLSSDKQKAIDELMKNF